MAAQLVTIKAWCEFRNRWLFFRNQWLHFHIQKELIRHHSCHYSSFNQIITLPNIGIWHSVCLNAWSNPSCPLYFQPHGYCSFFELQNSFYVNNLKLTKVLKSSYNMFLGIKVLTLVKYSLMQSTSYYQNLLPGL